MADAVPLFIGLGQPQPSSASTSRSTMSWEVPRPQVGEGGGMVYSSGTVCSTLAYPLMC